MNRPDTVAGAPPEDDATPVPAPRLPLGRPVAKLPVPGPWQAAVQAAMSDLAARTGKPLYAVAPTRVEPVSWRDAATNTERSGLSIWLMTGGRTFKYMGDPALGTAEHIATPGAVHDERGGGV